MVQANHLFAGSKVVLNTHLCCVHHRPIWSEFEAALCYTSSCRNDVITFTPTHSVTACHRPFLAGKGVYHGSSCIEEKFATLAESVNRLYTALCTRVLGNIKQESKARPSQAHITTAVRLQLGQQPLLMVQNGSSGHTCTRGIDRLAAVQSLPPGAPNNQMLLTGVLSLLRWRPAMPHLCQPNIPHNDNYPCVHTSTDRATQKHCIITEIQTTHFKCAAHKPAYCPCHAVIQTLRPHTTTDHHVGTARYIAVLVPNRVCHSVSYRETSACTMLQDMHPRG